MKPVFCNICGASHIFTNADEYRAATFSPDHVGDDVIRLEVKGRTYAERKSNLQDLAIDIQAAEQGGISWYELAIIRAFLYRNARRYGLVAEFAENGIV